MISFTPPDHILDPLPHTLHPPPLRRTLPPLLHSSLHPVGPPGHTPLRRHFLFCSRSRRSNFAGHPLLRLPLHPSPHSQACLPCQVGCSIPSLGSQIAQVFPREEL